MKKILLLMMCCPMILSAQNGVTVSNLDVKPGTVTFNVSWEKADMPAVWSDSVWVFVDYNKNGVMTRLPVTNATATAGTVIKIQGNDKGAWIVGNARNAGSFSAKVHLLTDITDVVGVCAYASNYPPVGEYTSVTDIVFTGTPMYNIVLEHASGSTMTRRSDSPFSVPASYTVQSFTDATGAPGMMKCVLPATYTLQVSASSFCAGSEGVQFALSGTDSERRYQLYRDDVAVDGAELAGTGDAATFTGSFSEAGAYTAQTIADKKYCAIAMDGAHAIAEKSLPELRADGSVTQTVDWNTPITAITFTAASATIALSSGGFPAGVTGVSSGTPSSGSTFTISGTPTSAGTFNYTVTATHADGGCTSTLSGAITAKSTTPTYAASTQTWRVSGTAGTQTWSAPINIPGCGKTTYSATNSTADCRNNGTYGYLYSWVYVSNNASTLCDNGWRVPTSTDFCTLDKILNNNLACTDNRSGIYGSTYNSIWGGSYGGYVSSSNVLGGQGTYGEYWSSTAYSGDYAHDLEYTASHVRPVPYDPKGYGFQVRCVK
jgi:uncharacterized protein (TIGR02145 family)